MNAVSFPTGVDAVVIDHQPVGLNISKLPEGLRGIVPLGHAQQCRVVRVFRARGFSGRGELRRLKIPISQQPNQVAGMRATDEPDVRTAITQTFRKRQAAHEMPGAHVIRSIDPDDRRYDI